MAFENFLERLAAGDVRSFIVLALLALVVFVVYRYLNKALRPYQGYIRFMGFLLVGLLLYIWIIHPERIGGIFNGIVDWINERIEPLIEGDDSASWD